MPAWPSLVMVGFCRYVESAISCKVESLNKHFRLRTVLSSAHATTFVGVPWTIALRLGVVVLVRSRRSAVKLSWRRTVSKDFLDDGPSECYIVDLVPSSCVVVNEMEL